MKLSDDEYYRELRQNTASKEGSDSVGARTNHTGPRRTASVFRGSAAHCSEVPGSPGISQGVVRSQEVAGLVGRSVQYTDTVFVAGPVGAGELGHQEDIERSLPGPKTGHVPVARLVCLFKHKGWNICWQLK